MRAAEAKRGQREDADEEDSSEEEDAAELTLETAFYGEKCELRREQMAVLRRDQNEDVIVAAHGKMRLNRARESNKQLENRANELKERIKEVNGL